MRLPIQSQFIERKSIQVSINSSIYPQQFDFTIEELEPEPEEGQVICQGTAELDTSTGKLTCKGRLTIET
ncbi:MULTISPECIES: hypothetical protein [unclassified Coleofasciculus]|uniref:hypothetical protein n=1 Tax=unclassified Coleofasciculus TaxID=2692782 RepID=UPI001881F9E2|nr:MULTISPECIES: hypothetical protein [unclassified Coleofasciculus]MBE9128371.1 hypothetical protein [Coleofasciculus sp. LEGE 07081]MBE9151427.1 hypothetical protein [Coleofasciculus sp. LEGE 07092]